jgi:hypothetical protein
MVRSGTAQPQDHWLSRMFGKKPPQSGLAKRVRALAERSSIAKTIAARPARQSVFRNASVLLDSGARHVVAIKDLSQAGARIEFFQDLPIAGEFTLSEPVSQLRRRVRVTWRTHRAAGLAFID